MDEYYCTNCGATLNDQYGFDPDQPWTCTECGTTLFGDGFPEGNRFPGVVWHCDGCGAVLNTQQGFDDEEDEWECTECGYTNSLSDSQIFESEASYRTYKTVMGVASFIGGALRVAAERNDYSDDSGEEEDSEGWDDYDNDDSSYSYSTNDDNEEDSYDYGSHDYSSDSYEERKVVKIPLRTRIALFWGSFLRRLKIALIAVVVLAVAVSAFGIFYYKTNAIPVGFSSEWAVGKNYETVVKKLETQGFTRVMAEGIEDLPYESLDEAFTVSEVSLSGDNTFDEKTTQLPAATVRVYYHSPMQVALPFSAKAARGMDYHEVVAQLKEAGFGSIEVKERNDLVFGLLERPDIVADIVINGEKEFELGDEYPVDAEIIIEYHAFKKR